MTNEKLYEVIGNISDKHINEAKQVKKTKQPVWLKWGVMAACLCIIAGLSINAILISGMNNEDKDTVALEEHFNTVYDCTTDYALFNWGLTLSAKNITSTGLTLVVTQSGGEPTGILRTGEPYRLVAFVGETWKDVEELPLPEGVDGYGWNSLAYNIPMEDSTEFEINWEWIYGELPSGRYRLVKNFMDFRKTADYDTADYTVEFTIE